MIDLLIVVVDQRIERIGAIAAMLVLAVLLGGPLGTLLAALLPRELEGALALLIVLSVQLLADPDQALAKAMPFWSLRQLGTYAVTVHPARTCGQHLPTPRSPGPSSSPACGC